MNSGEQNKYLGLFWDLREGNKEFQQHPVNDVTSLQSFEQSITLTLNSREMDSMKRHTL